MKSNQEIIKEWSGGLTGITNDEALEAMKEAQVGVMKELIKRKWDNSIEWFNSKDGKPSLKSIDDLVLELIKEIERS